MSTSPARGLIETRRMSLSGNDFASTVIRWQQGHGRHDLPWQQTRDPYPVWLSEIMLQQTQVGTVKSYFARFLERFPNLNALAAADLDDVLSIWSGLGYYSRARNLHRCAQEVRDRFGGSWPRSADVLQTLPGIGRSTAAAISAFCFGERVAILDGNVRRVLSRVLGFDSDLSKVANQRALWNLAEQLLPVEQLHLTMPAYTQGLMDLGATVCRSRGPECGACPVAYVCIARLCGDPHAYPVRGRKLVRGMESLWLLWAVRPDGSVWLERRPTPGVWAGLYCLPVFTSSEAVASVVPAFESADLEWLPVVTHSLTHKDLSLHPVRISMTDGQPTSGAGGAWFSAMMWSGLGLPAPIRKMLSAAV